MHIKQSCLSALWLSGFLLLLCCSFSFGQETGQQIYEETLEASKTAEKEGAPNRDISNILLKGAGQCRDAGFYYYAIELFEASLQKDPTNAYLYRIFGDFIMGYRGLYEYAGTKYFRALELVDLEPENYDDTFKTALTRSVQIFHRDGGDGLPLFNTHSTDDYSLFIEPIIEYRKPSSDHFEKLNLFELQLKAGAFIDRTIRNINNDPNLNLAQKNAFIAREETKRGEIPNRLSRRQEQVEKQIKLLLRFGNEKLPYVEFSWTRVDIDPQVLNVETFEEADGEFTGYSLLVGKNLFLAHNLDLNLEGMLLESKIDSFSTISESIIDSREESGHMDFDLQSKLTYYFGTNTLKLTLGGGFRDIDRTEADGTTFPDSSNSQRAILRLSIFKTPEETENPSRFRGRRSTHYEIGFRRTERDFETQTSYLDYLPHVSMEYLGLLGGHLDLIFNYNSVTRKYKSDSDNLDIPTPVLIKGKYDAHQFQVIPTWVLVYQLYEDTFKRGIEFLSLGFPLSYTLGEKAGDYTRVNAGIRLEGQVEFWRGLRILPRIEGDYAYYPELNRDDWGVFLKCAFRY